jgi:hypothetical protein
LAIPRFIKRRQETSPSESDGLSSRITEAKGRLLSGIAKIRAEQKVIELDVGRRAKEALRLRKTDEQGRYQISLKRWKQARSRVERLDSAIDFMERHVELLEDASLGVKIGEITALTGHLLSDLNLVNPDIKNKMEDFEVDFVNLTGNVKELLEGVQPIGYAEVPEAIQEFDELDQMLIEETSKETPQSSSSEEDPENEKSYE